MGRDGVLGETFQLRDKVLLYLLELTQFKILRLNHFIEAINEMLQLGQLALDDDEAVFKGGGINEGINGVGASVVGCARNERDIVGRSRRRD